ncbi:MAG: DedA family protein [Candidatus Parvarchaeota archaeon]|nr:DedA family protein [Candidatus Parvarchaeota archaeon]
MAFLLDQISVLIYQYRYLAVFVLMFLESVALPIPSEVVLPFAGAMIGLNILDPVIAFPIAVIASVLGSLVGFLLGYFLGVDIIFRYGKKFGFRMKSYSDGEKWIKKYGVLFALISKLLPAIRSISSIICGAFKMDIKKFLLYTTVGIIVWSAALMYAGYALASNWNQIASSIASSALYVVIGSIVVLLVIIRRWVVKTANSMLLKLRNLHKLVK